MSSRMKAKPPRLTLANRQPMGSEVIERLPPGTRLPRGSGWARVYDKLAALEFVKGRPA
jgi:hypothetical protein